MTDRIKDYIYINQRLLDNIFVQIPENKFLSLKYKLGLKIKIFEAFIEKELKTINTHEKIKKVYNYIEQNNFLKEASNNFIYSPYDYYCMEKLYFTKISLEHSKIKTKYDIRKINFYVSTDRTFTTIGNNSPLFLLPDNINSIGMDGSSGYSIFKLLMEDYLRCDQYFIKQINADMKDNFAKNPIKYFNELGCFVSDYQYLEAFYKKRSILKDYIHDIVYTFAYPIYISSLM